MINAFSFASITAISGSILVCILSTIFPDPIWLRTYADRNTRKTPLYYLSILVDTWYQFWECDFRLIGIFILTVIFYVISLFGYFVCI